jgi:hypothetical protein
VEAQPVWAQPEPTGGPQQIGGAVAGHPELALAGHGVATGRGAQPCVHRRAGGVLDQLGQLRFAVDGEPPHPGPPRLGDVRGRFDRVAVEHVGWVDTDLDQRSQLGDRGDLEPAAEPVQPLQHPLVRVALHRVVDVHAGQHRGEAEVRGGNPVQVEHQERGRTRQPGEPVGGQRVHHRCISLFRSSYEGMTTA